MALFETKATRREKERQHDLELARINARARVESEKYSADANEAMYRFKREELLSNNRQKVQEQIDDLIRRNPIDMILSLIKLYQQNTDAYVREYDGKSEKIERSNEAKIILAEIQTYKVPTSFKSIKLTHTKFRRIRMCK